MSRKEYLNFINTKEINPPSSLDLKIKEQISKDLKNIPKIMLKKLFFIHTISAIFTLSICPQFGVGPIGGGHGIAAFVMPYGDFVCGVFCGTIFLGTTATVSLFLLNTSELLSLNKKSLWVFPALATISLILLMTLGNLFGSHKMEYSTNFTLTWFVSGVFLSTILVKTKAVIAAKQPVHPL